MLSPIGTKQAELWSGGEDWGGVFGVRWDCAFDLPFARTQHLTNPLNEHKPVKICRDGQVMSIHSAADFQLSAPARN